MYLFQASLPTKFWIDALHVVVVHTLNLLLTTTLSFKTPFEILFGFFPTYDHLCVFRCLCYPNTSFTATYKLSPHSSAYAYLGPLSDHRDHRCLDLITQRLITSRHVVFDEYHFLYANFQSPSPPLNMTILFPMTTSFIFPLLLNKSHHQFLHHRVIICLYFLLPLTSMTITLRRLLLLPLLTLPTLLPCMVSVIP